MRIQGKVTQFAFALGSKSESPSLFITTSKGKIKLERQGGSPFMIDKQEKALVGKTVKLEGQMVGTNLFRFTDVLESRKATSKR